MQLALLASIPEIDPGMRDSGRSWTQIHPYRFQLDTSETRVAPRVKVLHSDVIDRTVARINEIHFSGKRVLSSKWISSHARAGV
jgi:hypothetical protein